MAPFVPLDPLLYFRHSGDETVTFEQVNKIVNFRLFEATHVLKSGGMTDSLPRDSGF